MCNIYRYVEGIGVFRHRIDNTLWSFELSPEKWKNCLVHAYNSIVKVVQIFDVEKIIEDSYIA
jgi:hypothetical protein